METRTLAVSVALCLVVTFPGVLTQVDNTLKPGAFGSDVVQAVVDRITSSCIFDDDKEYIRRVAYVESTDGAQPKTYRSGYHGGIWQVDEEMFNVTLASTAAYILEVNTYYNIDWASMTWSDLRKPLCSGLAARIYTEEMRGSTLIPRPAEDQGDFHVNFYRPGGDADVFTALVNELDQKCKRGGADIVFVLDASGSIGTTNFESMKTFVQDVVRGFNIAENETRISVIVFSSGSSIVFRLNEYYNKTNLIAAVANIVYTAGGTNTAAALNQLVDEAFLESNGGRSLTEGFPRVGIVVTDGQSNDYSATIQAAARAHAADLTMFAIGVGNPNEQELDAIATDPDCLHKFFLTGFSEFATLSSQIEKKLCNAPVIFQTVNFTVSDKVKPGESQNCRLQVSQEGATIQIITDVGKIIFYIAHNTYPSSTYYEAKVEASPGQPALIYIGYDQDGEVFCNYKAINVTAEESEVEIEVEPGEVNNCLNDTSQCGENGNCSSTLDSWYCKCDKGWQGKYCDQSTGNCPDGCIEFNKTCYFVSEEKTTYTNATVECEGMNGDLTSVLTPQENQFLADNKIPSGRYWIGLTRDEASAQADADVWSWVDGSPYSWTNWAPKNPKIDTRCAVMLRLNGIWSGVDCDDKSHKFICKKIPQETGPTCSCPADWEEYSDSCYWFSDKGDKKANNKAKKICRESDAELVSINSEGENDFVMDNRKNNKVHWLGLYRNGQDWDWSNGDPTGYTNWDNNQPGDDENCSSMNKRSGKWKASKCGKNKNMFVCEKEC